MLENQGWIKIHRKFLSWEWYTEPEMVRLFLHLLLSANHEDGQWKGYTIKRGQLITGRNSISKQTGISPQTVRTCLTRLKSTNEITTQPTNKFSLITILNYEKYQQDERKSTSKSTNQLTNHQPATNQQLTTNNNNKNNKNDKETTSCSSLMSDEDFETFYKAYPKKKNKLNAQKKFLKLPKEILPTILSALEKQKLTEQWLKDGGQFIPYPDTWINGKRWEDEVAHSDCSKLNKLEQEAKALLDKYGDEDLCCHKFLYNHTPEELLSVKHIISF